MNAELAGTILVVEDDPELREVIKDDLEEVGHHVLEAGTASHAVTVLRDEPVDLVISDLRLPDSDDLALLEATRELWVVPAFIVITAFGTVEQAVEAMQRGANNFLTKPLNLDHLRLNVARELKQRQMERQILRYQQVLDTGDFHGVVGRSKPMQQLFEQIRVVARASAPVLILGESGTGKELVARAIHEESSHANGPFIAVNCAGIPPDLLESELFGHREGAFTGAKGARKGLFVEASGGTILLDEIGEMPLAMQAKLLRVLEDGSMRPVGEDRELGVDTHVLAATNRDLEGDVEEGRFRHDLFYRLETFRISVPPLRDRGDDIDLLIAHLIARFTSDSSRPKPQLTPQALSVLRRYDYPGNVRELSNAIERAIAYCDGSNIEPSDLPERIAQNHSDLNTRSTNLIASIVPEGEDLPTLREVEGRYIKFVLEKLEGNKSRAASQLGIGRRTLYRYLDES